MRSYTDLHDAARKEDVQAIRELLNAGADVNAQDENGNVPLHTAALYEKIEVITALLKAGADVNARDEHGNTPLHWAARFNGNLDFVKVLLDAGADINAKNNEGKTVWDLIPDNKALRNAIDDGGFGRIIGVTV